MELVGKVRDRSVRTPELLQNTASGGVRERGKRGIEAGSRILNHVVQYSIRIGGTQGEASTRLGFTDYFRVELAWAKFLNFRHTAHPTSRNVGAMPATFSGSSG